MFDPIIPHLFIVTGFMAVVLKAAISDMNTLRISNGDNAALFILYPIYLSFTPAVPDVLTAIGIAVLVLLIGFLLFAKGLIGGGDVKMLTAVSLWAGPELMGAFLLITAGAGGVLAVVMISRFHLEAAVLAHRCGAVRLSEAITSRAMPYGAAIAAGAGYVSYRLFMLGGV